MKRSAKILDVVLCAQLDYLLPEGKASVPDAYKVILPGMRHLLDRTPENSAGVLFVDNKFTDENYDETDYANEYPAHCLTGGFGDYDPIGVQNVFSYRLLNSRGIPVFHMHKHVQDMWQPDQHDVMATVHVDRGGAQTAMFLSEFVGTMLDRQGINTINIWGASPKKDTKLAITGFLVRGFRVRRWADLCFTPQGEQVFQTRLKMMFEEQYTSGQLHDCFHRDIVQQKSLTPL